MDENYRVTIAHAVGSEEGTKNGEPGDQTGAEVRIAKWYISGEKDGKKWDYVIRSTKKVKRKKIAENAEAGARNSHLGYSQTDRYSAYDIVKMRGFDLSKLDKDANTDCSQMATICASFAGYPIPRDTYTGNMKERYKAVGGFKFHSSKKYTADYKKLIPGDILLRVGHHAAMVINNVYWLKTTIKKSNSTGRKDDVKALQARLNELDKAKLEVDGIWGPLTEVAVKKFQNDNGLMIDGIVGAKTATALGFVFGL